MIYEIDTKIIPFVLQRGGSLVIISADSQTALVKLSDLEGIVTVSTYDEKDLDLILANEKWRQPCTNC